MSITQLKPLNLSCNDDSEAAKKQVQTAIAKLGIKDAVLNKNILTVESLLLTIEFSWFPIYDFPETIISLIQARVRELSALAVLVEQPPKIKSDYTLPTTAKAKWIGLIPSLSFKIVGYETKASFYVQVSRTNFEGITVSKTFRNSGNGAFLHHGMNRCVKEAFEAAGLQSSDYAEQFDRTCPDEFVTRMLSEAVGNYATSGSLYIFERLDM